jgi:hypothetical protein
VASEGSRQLAEEVRKKAKEARDETARAPKPSPAVEAAVAPVTSEESGAKGEFIPAAVFVGRKVGYVFQRGGSGLGYYLDRYHNEPSSLPLPAAAPSPTMAAPTSVPPLPSAQPAAEHQSFPFEFRQTKEAVAVIVQIPGIIESSVDLRFGDRSFDLYFKAVSGSSSGGEGSSSDTAATRRLVEHSQGFDLFAEVLVERCKYDVATQNLVVLLHKLKPEYWLDRTAAAAAGNGAATSRREILSSRPYRSTRVASEKKAGTASEATSGSSAPSPSLPIPSPSELLEAMKFSTQGLLDLD